MRTHQIDTKNIFSGLFFARGLALGDCNAVAEIGSHNLYLFFRAVQIKNQTLEWVAGPLDPEAVFPRKKNWLRLVVYQVMREASRMGQPLNHMLHMLCTDIQSTMHLF